MKAELLVDFENALENRRIFGKFMPRVLLPAPSVGSHPVVPGVDSAHQAGPRDTGERSEHAFLDGGAGWDYFSEKAIRNPRVKVENFRRSRGQIKTAGEGEKLDVVATADVGNFKEAKIVKGLRSNLVSVSKLCDSEDCALIHTSDGVVRVPSADMPPLPDSAVMIAKRHGGLYSMALASPEGTSTAHLTDSQPTNILFKWHQRLGHMSPRRLLKGVRTGALRIPELENLDSKTVTRLLSTFPECPACGEAFGIRRNRSTAAVDARDTGVCPPVTTGFSECQGDLIWPWTPKSKEGYNGALFLVHRGTRMAFTTPLKAKSDAPEGMERLMMRLRSRLGLRPGAKPTKDGNLIEWRIRFDDDKSLTSKAVDDVLSRHGFRMEIGAAYHKNSIGLVDRVMRTVVAITRAIMVRSRAPATEWPYGLRHATMVYNLSPHSALAGESPCQKAMQFRGSTAPAPPIDVSMFRTFYAPVYVHQEDGVERTKSRRTSPIAKVGCYLGVPPGGRGHWIRLRSGGSPVVRRDVYFREDLDVSLQELAAPDAPSSVRGGEGKHERNSEPEIESNEDSGVEEDKTVEESKRPTRQRKPRVKHNVGGNQEDIIRDYSAMNVKMIIQRSADDSNAYTPLMDVAMKAVEDLPEPKSFKQATTGPEARQWEESIQEEYDNMTKFEVWKEVERPQRKVTLLNTILVFKKKRDQEGNVTRFKSRLCGDGRKQVYGIDYQESYAPVVDGDVMRMALDLMVKCDYHLCQFDFTAAFLNGKLDRDLYIRPPPGCKTKKPGNLLKLIRALYGTKQAAHLWCKELTNALNELGFIELPSAKCFYARKKGNEMDLTVIHVDDGILGADKKAVLDEIVEHLAKKFRVSATELEWFLSIKMVRGAMGMTLSIPSYIESLAKKFRVEDVERKYKTPGNPTQVLKPNQGDRHECPYMELVGALIYAQTACRPDVTQIANRLARYLSNPSEEHWKAAKRVLVYLLQTKNHGVLISRNFRSASGDPKNASASGDQKNAAASGDPTNDAHSVKEKRSMKSVLEKSELVLHTDSDYATDPDERKSVTGYLIYFNGTLVSWGSKKQPIVAQSSCEAEFVAANLGCKRLMKLRKVILELKFIMRNGRVPRSDDDYEDVLCGLRASNKGSQGIKLFTDSKSSHMILDRGALTQGVKHMDIRYNYVLERVNSGVVTSEHVLGTENPADLLTKNVKSHVHDKLIDRIVVDCTKV